MGTDANGCVAMAQVTLTVGSDCQLGYYVPNAFSPNYDGNNDVFRVLTSDSPKSFRMLVFNRFGGKVFESSAISDGWNGMVGGSPFPTGTYVYVIAITTSAGAVIDRKGTLELVR
jgi:gliding motility-associated-like protein